MSATTVALDVACGGVSTAVVSAILNPTDVIKTRRQIVGFSGASPLDMARDVARADGLRGLWLPGLQATVLRELLYSGCTKGLYPYARDAVAGEEDASLAQRALAAALTGFGGSLCANAVDVVKVQQFDSGSNRSVVAAMRDVARSEGVVRGLLVRGVSASAPRGAAIAIGEVTTYDYAKSRLARHPAFARDAQNGAEPFSLHIVTSVITPVHKSNFAALLIDAAPARLIDCAQVITGVVATTVAAPFDTIKSRVMARGGNAWTALRSLVAREGPAALLAGWWPAYCRLAPHAILTFPLLEQLRRLAGLENF